MGEKLKNFQSALRRGWKWYVLGHYHCDKCPYCWEDWSVEGDCDCGCYIYGDDLKETCRLIPPIRFLIGWPRMRKAQYFYDHEYDGIGEFWENRIKQEEAFAEALMIILRDKEVYRRSFDGKLVPMCKFDLYDSFGPSEFLDALHHYEDTAHPIEPEPPLKKQWKDLIRKSWNKLVIQKVAPYLPRKR